MLDSRRRGSFLGVWDPRREIGSLVMIGTRAPRIIFSPSIGIDRRKKPNFICLRCSGEEAGAFLILGLQLYIQWRGDRERRYPFFFLVNKFTDFFSQQNEFMDI